MLERVQKIMSNAGVCSRRKAEEFIEKGLVKVNGKVITLGDKADAETDDIEFRGRLIRLQEVPKKYILFNKPKGFLVTRSDPRNRKTIFDIVRIKERLMPVGRLDKDTEGLIILTNDGDFANQVMHPRYEVEKTYRVRINKQIKESDIESIKKGIQLEDYKTHPAKVKKLSTEFLEITIHEGKNRIIRKMFEVLGYGVLELERTKIGKVSIKGLKKAKWRNLSQHEIASFLQ